MSTDQSKRTTKRYGWIKDYPLKSKKHFNCKLVTVEELPRSVDLRAGCPAVYDQGELGSCTANAIAGAHEFDQIKQKLENVFTPSRLFIYYNERVIENSIESDSGAMIHDGISVLVNQGVCDEAELPYDIEKFTDEPSSKEYEDALENVGLDHGAVNQDEHSLKQVLASGYPVVFGFTVYESFESEEVATTGMVPMPEDSEAVLGGHAVLLVGYDDDKSRFIVRNSWGSGWGDEGYFYLPYKYVIDRDLASDFWVVELVK